MPAETCSVPFIELTVQKAIHVKLRMAFKGREHLVVLGEPGTGKTYAVRQLLRRIEAEHAEDLLEGKSPVLMYDAMASTGSKATLVNLYNHVSDTEELRAGLRRMWSANEYCTHIVRQLIANGTRVVCLDEAQHLQPGEIDQLRQVADLAEREGHAIGLVLLGTPKLRHAIAATKQVGQRFSAFIEMPLLTRGDIASALPLLDPDLASLSESLSQKEWSRVVADISLAASGKWRRVFRIATNAMEYASRRGEQVGPSHIALAVAGLEAEC